MFKRITKKLFLFLTLIFLAFILLISGVMAVLWYQPQLILNESFLSWGQRKFFPSLAVEWEKIELKVFRNARGRYRIIFNGENFCQDLQDYGRACFKEIDLKVEVTTNFRSIQKIYVDRVVIVDEKIEITLPPSDPNQPSTQIDFDSYRSWLDKLSFNEKFIQLQDTSINLNSATKDQIWNLKAVYKNDFNFTVTQKELGLLIKGELKLLPEDLLQFDGHLDMNLLTAEIKFKIGIKSSKEVDLTGHFTMTPKSPDLKKLLRKVDANFKLSTRPQQLDLEVKKLNVTFNQKPLKSLTSEICSFSLPSSAQPLSVHCPALIVQLNLPAKFSELPSQAQFSLQSQFHLDLKRPSSISLKAKPIAHSLFHLNFEGETEFRFNEENKFVLENPQLSLFLKLAEFQKIVTRLRGSEYEVPAPFHVMNGSLEAEIKEIPKSAEGSLKVPFEVRSHLTSERNSVVGLVKGEVLYELPPSKELPILDLDILINQLYVQLPPFDPLRGIPPFVQDSRIGKTVEEKPITETESLKMKVRVKTSDEDSIRIYHPFVKPFATFNLNAKLAEDQTFSFSKGVRDFDLNYLKRSVTVQKLSISQSETQQELQVNGRLLYRAADYRVFIDFKGPLDKPEVILTSNPPLDRSDIISVLLYNQPSSNITSFEQESVGGTEAALADRAVGLFGIWAFASTPIETVAYNSVTKTYSAQIKLPEGFRLSVGTNWETVQNLELRRRLTRHWMISTIYRPSTQDGENKGEIMIQRRINY